MEIKFLEVNPNNQSLEHELVFSFLLKIVGFDITPINFTGKISTSEGKKIGNLIFDNENNFSSKILIRGVSNTVNNTNEILFRMSCLISPQAFNYIEKLRGNSDREDVKFNISLTVMTIENELQVSSIYDYDPSPNALKTKEGENRRALYYKYANGNYHNSRSDMYLISSRMQDLIGQLKFNSKFDLSISISYTKWIKEYIPYFNGHNVFVYELPTAPYKYIPKKLQNKFTKAINCLEAMKKQMDSGDWKSVVVTSRIIYELFKNLDDFDNLLLNTGYSQVAVDCFKKSIVGLFDFISKFHHAYGLKINRTDVPSVNPDIETNREDAIFIYVNCCSLLNLISEKSRRLGE